MTKLTTSAPSCTSQNSASSPAKGLHHASSQTPSTLAVIAAVIFTLASASTNLIYGLAKGVDLPTSIVWGGVAVAASIGLALAPSAFLASLSSKRYSAAAIALVATLIFGAYSVTAALGSASGGRTAAQSEATEIASARARHQATYDSAAIELATLAPTRPPTQLQAEIDGLLRTPGADGCAEINGRVTKTVCPQVDALKAEKARADKREQLQAAMSQASNELTKLPKPRVANSDAAALAGYLEAAGQPLTTDALNKVLVVLAVLVIELGGGLCLALALALRSEPGKVSAQIVDAASAQDVSAPQGSPVSVEQPASAPNPKKPGKRTRNNDKNGRGGNGSGGQRLGKNVVELLKKNGGKLEGGQRGLGRLVGLSKSRFNEVVRELHESGVAIVTATKFGTKVELAAA